MFHESISHLLLELVSLLRTLYVQVLGKSGNWAQVSLHTGANMMTVPFPSSINHFVDCQVVIKALPPLFKITHDQSPTEESMLEEF